MPDLSLWAGPDPVRADRDLGTVMVSANGLGAGDTVAIGLSLHYPNQELRHAGESVFGQGQHELGIWVYYGVEGSVVGNPIEVFVVGGLIGVVVIAVGARFWWRRRKRAVESPAQSNR
jgi:hypothetical protein